ncbi:MAG: response regulator [Desulfonatronovibrio sp.]
MNDKDDQITRLKEEVHFLREERRRSVLALEMAASLANFNTQPRNVLDRHSVFMETAEKLRTLIRFKAVSFYLVNEQDNSFGQVFCEPHEYSSFLEEEVEKLIEDHSFAWILRRNRPVVINSQDQKENLILRALATPSRIRGMFVGILDQEKKDIPDVLFSLLSIVTLSCSSALESIETYEYLKKVNQKLKKYAQESQRLYQDIFENAPVAIFRTTKEGKFLKVNPMYARIAGYESPEQMIDSIQDIGRELYVNPADRDDYQKILEKQGYVFNYEARLKRTNGDHVWVSMDSRTVRDQNNKVLYYDGFLRDITDRKLFQEALIKARDDAESANKAKSEFLANMSHELRTPLNGIMGMLQLLETTGLEPDKKEYVDKALKSGHRLTELLSNILDLCRIEKGRMVVEEKPLMISNVIRKISETFGVVCQNKGIFLETWMDENIPPFLMGDEIRIRSILFNLTGNAIKFTEQGRVSLKAHFLNRDIRDNVHILFIVSDTGVGISEEAQGNMFESFVQAQGCYTRKFEGAGLGLSVVKRTLSLIRGHICFVSKEGEGTTFYVSVPFRTQEQQDSEAVREPQSLDRARKSSKRILLVEDEPVNMFFAQKMLGKLGFETLGTDDGAKAVEHLKKEKFDCILMDIQLKDMDGVQATKIIRSHDGSMYDPDIPIIAVTSYALSGDRDKFFEAGMNEYISKPLRVNTLKKILNRILS